MPHSETTLTPALSRKRERERAAAFREVPALIRAPLLRGASRVRLRMIARELVRRRTRDRADVRRVAHVQIDFATEIEVAFDDRARANHDARILVLAP